MRALKYLLDLFFPEFCCVCSRINYVLCPNCYEKLDFLFLPVELKLETNYLDRALAACHYNSPAKKLVKAMKYRFVKSVADLAGEILFETVDIPLVDLITFVPLHPKKQNWRGFNQAEVMAKSLGLQLRLPVSHLLERTKHTPSQASIKQRSERLTQLSTAFTLVNGLDQSVVDGQRILLIDDVITTGTTLNECAHILKQAGAQSVTSLSFAHGQ